MRTTRFSLTFSGNESGDQDAVLNSKAPNGLLVYKLAISWEPHTMASSTDELPYLVWARYTGAASGGTPGKILSFPDSVTPASSLLLGPSLTFATLQGTGTQYWPGTAIYEDLAWYMQGGYHEFDFNDNPIEVADGNSLWIRSSNTSAVSAYFEEAVTA